MKNVLNISNITVMRSGITVNSGISLCIESGNAVVVYGENGVGKTTLLRCIAGFLPTEKGSITINAQRVYRQDLNGFCHFVGEEHALKNFLTVQENLTYWQYGASRRSKALESALQTFHLAPLRHTKTSILSQGQKKRVALSRLLIANRIIWILDEPTNGLDNKTIRTFNKVVRTHLNGGGIVLCASHVPVGFPHKKYTVKRYT